MNWFEGLQREINHPMNCGRLVFSPRNNGGGRNPDHIKGSWMSTWRHYL